MRRMQILWLVLAAACAASGPAAAHGDHGAAPPGAVVIAPRAEARSGAVEIVAEFTGGTLAVFLSRYADDAPVIGAKVEAATDLQSAPLAETDAGVYVTKDILFADGRNDVSVTFTVAGVARTQALAITIAEPHPAAAAPPPPAAAWPVPSRQTVEIAAGAALAAALLAAAIMLTRRLRRPVRAADVGVA
jgi:hypothetical protein